MKDFQAQSLHTSIVLARNKTTNVVIQFQFLSLTPHLTSSVFTTSFSQAFDTGWINLRATTLLSNFGKGDIVNPLETNTLRRYKDELLCCQVTFHCLCGVCVVGGLFKMPHLAKVEAWLGGCLQVEPHSGECQHASIYHLLCFHSFSKIHSFSFILKNYPTLIIQHSPASVLLEEAQKWHVIMACSNIGNPQRSFPTLTEKYQVTFNKLEINDYSSLQN